MKKITFMLFALIAAVSANAQVTVGDFTYNFYTSGNAYITAYSGTDTEITIPATITYNDGTEDKTVDVTGFGPNSFANNTTIQKIHLPNAGAYTLGKEAFKGCTALNTLNYAESSGYGANTYSRADKYIILPQSTLNEGVFEGCTSITRVYSRPSLTGGIGARAFKGCTNLTWANVSAACPSIGKRAFEGCTYLATLLFGNTGESALTEIADSVFINCQFLKQVGPTASIVSFPNVTKIGVRSFYGAWTMTAINIPAIENISNYAFYNPYSNLSAFKLETVTGCENLTYLGQYAFYRCANLKTIGSTENVVSLPKVYQVRAYAFKDCQSIETVKMNQSTDYYSYFYQDVFNGCTSLQRVITQYAVREVGTRAFSGASSLVGIGPNDTQSYVNLPKATLLNTSAFENCTSMKSVYLNDASTTLATIGAKAFNGCTDLDLVVIRNMTPSALGEDAFSGIKSDAAFLLNPTNSYKNASNYANNDGWKTLFNGTNANYTLIAYVNKPNQYGTVSCDVPLYFIYASTPAIYKVTETNDASAHLEAVSSKKLPANTGAVMEKDITKEGVQVRVLFDGSESAADFDGNLLVANVTENTEFKGQEDGKYNLILVNGEFVKATDGTLAGGLAYLPAVLDNAEAKLGLTFDDVTGIENVGNEVQNVENGVWYTPQGVRVAQPTKGVYIHNGKKVLVK